MVTFKGLLVGVGGEHTKKTGKEQPERQEETQESVVQDIEGEESCRRRTGSTHWNTGEKPSEARTDEGLLDGHCEAIHHLGEVQRSAVSRSQE